MNTASAQHSEPTVTTPYAWFTRLWAGAILLHLAGNPGAIRQLSTPGLLEIGMGVLAVSLLFRPADGRLVVLAGLHVPVVLLTAPVVGNHEYLELLVHLLIIGSFGLRRAGWRSLFVPAARATLLAAYSFMAFSKLNTDFFDPSVSCAVVFADELIQTSGLLVSDYTALANLVIWGIVLAELAVPLLLVGRVRYAVPFALAFHFVLALDPPGHVFDFSSTLLPLFLLFLPSEFADYSQERLPALASPRWRIGLGLVLAGEVLVLVLDLPIWLIAWPVWLVLGGAAWWLTFSYARTAEPLDRGPMFLPLHPVLAVVVVLAALNGLAPYLELKTATGFNMYSNLLTAGGETNHLIVPQTLPLTNGQDYLLDIVDTSDPRLDRYRSQGLSLPAPSLLTYLENHPQSSAVVAVAGQTLAVPSPDAIRLFGSPPGWFEQKFGHFRAVDQDGPKSCLRRWEAAH